MATNTGSVSGNRPAGVSSATRLAVAFALVAGVPSFLLGWLFSWPDWDYVGPAQFAAVIAGFAAALGYLAAFYLRLFMWLREGFRAERRLPALRHLRFAGGLCLSALVLLVAALILRYEVAPTGRLGDIHYYLVWDRWSGDVKVGAQMRPRREEKEVRQTSW